MTPSGGLKHRAVSGLKWSSLSQLGRQGMQFVTIALLARLLNPDDFGLMGMATVVTGFIALFKDLGTASATIQQQELSPSLLSGLFWVNAAIGLLAAALLYFCAPVLAIFYQEPRVMPLLQFLSCTFIISGLGTLHQALLQRELAFARLAQVELVATLSGAVVGIGAALAGQGVWSLAYQTLAMTTVTTTLAWVVLRWRPSLSFNLQELRGIASYSLNLTGFNLFNYFARNADYLLIGRYLGAVELGYYTLAYRLMLYPLQNIASVVARVMFPVYSRLQDDNPRFRRTYLRIAGAIALVTFPLMLGLLALATPFVQVVFGETWQPVVILLQILAPLGMAQSIVTLIGSIYQAKGRTDWLFRWGLVASTLFVLAFVVGLRWGVVGVAVAYAITFITLSYPAQAIPFKLIGLRVGDLMAVLWPPLTWSSLMFLALIIGNKFLPPSLSTTSVLTILTVGGGLLYSLLALVFGRKYLAEIVKALQTNS